MKTSIYVGSRKIKMYMFDKTDTYVFSCCWITEVSVFLDNNDKYFDLIHISILIKNLKYDSFIYDKYIHNLFL